jgi:hypothetical protein
MVETGSFFINNEPVAEIAVEAINNIENSLKKNQQKHSIEEVLYLQVVF